MVKLPNAGLVDWFNSNGLFLWSEQEQVLRLSRTFMMKLLAMIGRYCARNVGQSIGPKFLILIFLGVCINKVLGVNGYSIVPKKM